MFVQQKLKNWQQRLIQPVDASSLAVFRILFGLFFTVYIFVYHPTKVVAANYIIPEIFFPFPLFEYLGLKPWPPMGMYIHLTVVGVAAFCVMVGFYYRFFAGIFFLTFGYLFLLEKSYSPNPYYLYTLIAFLLVWTSANQWASLDGLRKPKYNAQVIPYWNIFILRAQIFIAYFFSGVGKLTHPDWLQGRQFRIWLGVLKEDPYTGLLHTRDWVVYAFSYGGILFDLSIGFLLCYRRTRWVGIVLALCFHFWNKYMLNLQSFPWFMLLTLVVFLNPDEPRRIINKVLSITGIAVILSRWKVSRGPQIEYYSAGHKKWAVRLIVVYFAVQLVVPLRHWLYPDQVNWTHRGQQFSWQFMNNNMWGEATFHYEPPPGDKNFKPAAVMEHQRRWMCVYPDMILQYAHYLRDELKKRGVQRPVVTVNAVKSLNGREPVPFIDPTVNLAEVQEVPFAPSPWILPHPDERN